MSTDALSLTLSALADPTRRNILAQLARGEASVNDLAAPYPMSLAAVSKHIKVLEDAGLVSRTRHAQFRPCKLETAPMEQVAAFIDAYVRHRTASLDRLDDYLTKLSAGDPDGTPN
ncbi:MAG: ArsR family transcriptional regulator [Devosia sp.]|nr:ArsR family transcriptional regulator [Devosia sp.]